MTLLRGLGRLRRDENGGDFGNGAAPRPGSAGSGAALHHRGPRGGGSSGDAPDLWYEDRELGDTVRALEDVRGVLRAVAGAADAHKELLIAAAGSQRALGAALVEALDVGAREAEEEFGDLDVGGAGGGAGEALGVVAGFLSEASCDSQRSMGHSLVAHSGSVVKLGVAFCSPIADLLASFEERFARKIVPLRKRYADQKGQWMKYVRQGDAAEEDEKRNYFDALAQAARPVWVRTSKELRMEATVMTQLTSRNIARWSKGLALQHERALAIAAASYADAFTRAKALAK